MSDQWESDDGLSVATAIIVTELAMSLREFDFKVSNRLVERLQAVLHDKKAPPSALPLIDALIKDLQS